ncbi:hypothetical protein QJS66_23180 [Kocuria rhizophila]|nr:hypothetical protein QJS66_23180 [Kocuria rhizophila]
MVRPGWHERHASSICAGRPGGELVLEALCGSHGVYRPAAPRASRMQSRIGFQSSQVQDARHPSHRPLAVLRAPCPAATPPACGRRRRGCGNVTEADVAQGDRAASGPERDGGQ